MENPENSTFKLTVRLPIELAQQMDAERVRLAAEMGTSISTTQILERLVRRGLRVGAA